MSSIVENMPETSSISGSKIIVLFMVAVLAGCASLPGYNLFGGKGTVTFKAPSWCVPFRLKRVLRQVAYKYGDVTVYSTYRSWWKNRKVGGAQRSLHRRCKAVDFVVDGNMSAVLRFVRKSRSVGGYKRYSSGHIHIDTGSKRTW